VANKTDLRADKRTVEMLAAQGQRPVSKEQGMEVAKRIGARYAECSSKEGWGVGEVMQLGMGETLRKGRREASASEGGRKKRAGCTIL
jgi:Ras homolog gene family, member A